ncbi:MAG: hypothetical protein SF070_16445 [Gemmatimonadota bacterium]|nr:hypothetical protein [Gemmatimonadota bacterium]
MYTALLLTAMLALSAGDTVRVRSTASPAWGARIVLRPEFVIGQVDGPPEVAFGSIELLAATRSGEFVLFDGADIQLRRYDRGGRFLGAIGRKGSGPGEYQHLQGLAWLGDSLLAAYDPDNARITLFGATGEFRATIPIQTRFFGDKAFVADTAGLLWLRTIAGPPEGGESPVPTWYVRIDYRGQVRDSVPFLPLERKSQDLVLMTRDGPRWNFPSRSLAAPSPLGGVVSGHSARLGFTVTARPGRILMVDREATPLPLTGAERAQWEAWHAYMVAQGRTAPSPLPSRKPLVRDLVVDPAGRVWLEVYAPAEERAPTPRRQGDTRPQLTLRDATTYEVFAADGKYLGRIALPPESQVLAITQSRLWLFQRGPEDEEQVAAYALPPR